MVLRRMIFTFLTAFILGIISGAVGDKPCIGRRYNHSSIVCVCNSTYCDEISQIQPLPAGKYVLYTSGSNGLRFHKKSGSMKSKIPKVLARESNDISSWFQWFRASMKAGDVTLEIRREKTYQEIIGFGGAFTDAAGINIGALSEETQNKLMASYYSDVGLEYNMGRVPIAGTDFSTHPYAYNVLPEDDTLLSNFSLSEEDFSYKIPYIQQALQLSTDEVFLLCGAWSPPVWMKSNRAYGGASRLLDQYYQTWADYHLKFLEEYSSNNISFWGMSTGNEPSNGVFPVMAFNSLGWTPSTQAAWVANNLGPTIRNSSFSDVKILALDDQRLSLPWWVEWMAENKKAMQYIDGVAVHWYWDELMPPSTVDKTHDRFPDKFLLGTEACVGDKPWQREKVELGSWSRAEMYIKDIIEDLNHWFVGWIDWNLALDSRGSPNWYNNFVDAPVITLPDSDEFLKQPMFYALGHFSKFLPRGARRVHVEELSASMENVAFLRPDGGIAVVMYNRHAETERAVTIQEQGKGSIKIQIPPQSISTLVYY